MSAMAVTVTNRKRQSVSGSTITTFHSVAFTGTYSAGGEAFDANTVSGLSNVDSVVIDNGAMQGFEARYIEATKKLAVFGESTEQEDDAVDPGTADTAGGRPFIEFANGGDLTGITALKVTITGTR